MLLEIVKIKIIRRGTLTTDFQILCCFFEKIGLKINFMVNKYDIHSNNLKTDINFKFQQNILFILENKFLV